MRSGLWLLIAVSLGSLGATCGSAPPGPVRPSAAAERIHARYQEWKQQRPDAAVTSVALGFARGVTRGPVAVGGVAEIDLQSRSLRLELAGVAQAAEVWLVDNRGSGALPEADDVFVRAGSVPAVSQASSAARARLQLALEPSVADGFEIDRVVVAAAGTGPRGELLLVGAPGTFERLYARETAGTLAAGDVALEIERLLRRGRLLFEQETFDGNGRTCATCHPANNNFTIDPRFIATLPDDAPLFVAERVPELAELENSRLLRGRGVILENLDGFDRPGVLRGVPPTLALATSVTGPAIPFDNTANPPFGIFPPAERTGWSGDGAPGSASLREFAIGAVFQHFPRTLERVPGSDFRVPTDPELDALEIFQLSLGRQSEQPEFAFADPIVAQGKTIFERLDTAEGSLAAGKCALCHSRAGANIDEAFFSEILGAPVQGNANFGTGVNELRALASDLVDPGGAPRDGGFARVEHDGVNCVPPTGGFGTVTPEGGALPAGLCEEDFNTPPLIEAADTGPFFHNNAVDTLEAAVAFYNDDAFNESAGGQLLSSLDSGGIGIRLDASEVSAVASFLRAVNALENIRVSLELIEEAAAHCHKGAAAVLERTLAEERDAIEVLAGVGLQPDVVALLDDAVHATKSAKRSLFCHTRARQLKSAKKSLQAARDRIAHPSRVS